MYDELWDAIVDLGLPPSFHILTSKSDRPVRRHVRGPKLNSFMTHRARQPGHHRHADLRRGVRASSRAAGRVRRGRRRLGAALDVPRRSRLRPSSQLADRGRAHAPPERVVRASNVYLTFQDDWVAFRTADLMNTDRLMWANDFPHSDATWPNSQAAARRARAAARRARTRAASCTTTSPSSTASPSEAVSEPVADRPDMPEGYLGAAPLPWSWAEEQLTDARNYWITTIGPTGRPHVRPVWGVWLDDTVQF